ncbi:hypothetical protein BDP55DRAFT_239454 [Colletotrichum godetiae]|uniref:Uncharacterized protein n=1 Tax=Colletotrichum godetiae TaxID=1209918 RepID=A0AAJ0EV12_9PEZI|nr:uncharacterized protein BDP55DRAFT_239454 [Colletotrichum godetiae]KAK1672805.1 hypothetical protein BDP55DRAFT_239454 [Colletotrichum godetiae]
MLPSLASTWLLLRSCSFSLSFLILPHPSAPCSLSSPLATLLHVYLDLSIRRLPSPYSYPPTLILTHPSPHLTLISTTTPTQRTGTKQFDLTGFSRNDRSLATSRVTVIPLSQERGWLIFLSGAKIKEPS